MSGQSEKIKRIFYLPKFLLSKNQIEISREKQEQLIAKFSGTLAGTSSTANSS